jgi:hypothetical protein
MQKACVEEKLDIICARFETSLIKKTGSTCTENGRVCIISTKCYKIAALTSMGRNCGPKSLQHRS